MNKINVNKLKKFIEDNANKRIDSYQFNEELMQIKLGILQQAERALEKAIKEKNSAMVAAIAELLKTI